MQLRIHPVTSSVALQDIAAKFRRDAIQQHTVRQTPIPSKTVDELQDRIVQATEEGEGIVVELLSFKHSTSNAWLRVSVILSIDAFEGPPVWHLSMGFVLPDDSRRVTDHSIPQPGRVSDELAKIITQAFFPSDTLVEGPPEGVFPNVRHFRCPCLLD